jgi:hypothetical protein
MRMVGDEIEVTEGIESGSRIVIARAPFLTENMKVTLLSTVEQAEPRPEDRR